MRNERHTKEDFLAGVKNRINNGSWGLEELNYLNDYHAKYHLNYEDIGDLLDNAFKYAYQLALEDGIMNQLESDQLGEIQKLSMAPIPQNRMQREALKHHIMFLMNKIEFNHALQEQAQLQEDLAPEPVPVKKPEPVPEVEPVKHRVNSVYHRTPRPKLTPYSYW